MIGIFIAWAISAAVLLAAACFLGIAIKRGPFGILIDDRGRYSLSHVQVVLWTWVVLSLIVGVFVGRLIDGTPADALDFAIPAELLIVLGINLGSSMTVTAVKTNQNNENPQSVAASAGAADPPRFSQIFLVERGASSDAAVDVAKFQSFWFTLILVAAYVAVAIGLINGVSDADDIAELPKFSDEFLVLLGISHAAYVGGKLPTVKDEAPGLKMSDLRKIKNLTEDERKAYMVSAGIKPRKAF
jgi:hypothetical protein